jgi:hypothetical protein
MAINAVTAYQQVLSMAIEERSPSYQDLVSNANVLLATLKRKGLWEAYSGPRIRETLQIAKQDAQWYSGYDFLDNPPIELFNDAYYTPKMVAVPISLTMEEILNNQGANQLKPVLKSYMMAAERSLTDTMDLAIHSDGTANGGKQLTGLAAAVPIVTNSGTYGGIDRGANAIWRTTTYDLNSAFTTIGTQVTSTTVRPFLNRIMTARSRGKTYADLIIMSPEHYEAYDAATLLSSAPPIPAARTASWAFRRWSTSAAASGRKSSWMAASARTCRRTRPTASTRTACAFGTTRAATSTSCLKAMARSR